MKKTTATLTSALGLVLGSLHAQTVPPFINYQGTVTDSAGAGLGAGTPVNRKVIFRIFDAPTGGARLWSEQHTVTISNGEFSVLLGNGIDAVFSGVSETPLKATTPLDSVFTGAGILRYVEIVVDNGDNTLNATDAPIAPRQQITSTAYSFRARAADTITSGTDLQLNGSANYGLGYYGSTRLFNGTPVDGPVLFGQAGGALGAVNGTTKSIALRWNAAGAVGIGSADLSGAAATTKLVLQGDDANAVPLQLNIRGNTDTNKRLLLGYNTTSNFGSLQSYSAASTTSNLLLNPAGGNVGIGITSTPGNKLSVNGNADFSGRVVASGAGGFGFGDRDSNGGIFSPADGTMVFKTNLTEAIRINSYGDVLISKSGANPTNKLQIIKELGSSDAAALQHSLQFQINGVGNKSLGIGVLDNGSGMIQSKETGVGYYNLMLNPAGGNVGIGTTAPGSPLSFANSTGDKISLWANTGVHYGFGIAPGLLQIHTDVVGASIAFGYGTSALMTETMRITGTGRVGIGTTNPMVPLEVANTAVASLARLGYLANGGFNETDATSDWGTSIRAANTIAAPYFVVLSDARVKNIRGRSESGEDLKILQEIEVTDYTMKDPLSGSDKLVHKKVIAQQVEKVYPRAVRQGLGTVPDIMKMTTIKDGWITRTGDLKKGERVRLICQTEDCVREVLEVDLKENRFRVDLKSADSKVFVYGREVKDLRTVDYDAISMLNVSATQQIKKEKDAEVNKLSAENSELRARVVALEVKDSERDSKISAMEKILNSSDRKTVSLTTGKSKN